MSQRTYDLLGEASRLASKAVNTYDPVEAYKLALKARDVADQAYAASIEEGDVAEAERSENIALSAEKEAFYAAKRAKDKSFKKEEKKSWLALQKKHEMTAQAMREKLYPSARNSR